jgi:DNA repair protein RadD
MTLPLFDRAPLDVSAKLPPALRPYQQRALIELRARILFGKRRLLAVAPTASGKMVLVAAITRMATVPMIFVAHRMELIDQCADQLGRFGLTNVGIIRADDHRTNPDASIQVCSIQSLARREKPFANLVATAERPYPQLIFIDEAHRAASESYRKLLDHYPMAVVIGLTATPVRLDGRALGDFFEDMVQLATYGELLKRPDWLVAPDVFSTESIDLSLVHTTIGDYDTGELAQVMHTDRLEGRVVEHWLQRAHLHPVFDKNGARVHMAMAPGERRRTIVFAVNIAHSVSLADRFEKAGVRVAHLDGETPENERRAILSDLGAGRLELVCNCNVAVEGIDVPEVKCIVSARPTQSITMWRQQVGREMRPWNSVSPLLLDHGGNFDRLGCPFEDLHWSLTTRPSRGSGQPPMKLCKACFAYVECGCTLCPFCGYQFTVADRKTPSETSAQLVERGTDPEALKLDFFNRQVVVARSRGFKPGYPSALYKERYGTWPPWEWSERVKLEFGTDLSWQDAAARRAKKKVTREAQEAAEKAAMDNEQAMAKVRQQFQFRTELGVSETEYMQSEHKMQSGHMEIGAQMPSEPIDVGAQNQQLSAIDEEDSFSDWLDEQGITTKP